ncbi:MAG TPA: acetoin utilization protein AcuC, partial [Savagea sp.]
YIEAMERICEHFKPDVILTQNGADAHMYDPLTHLHCSIDLYETIPKVARRLADKYCEGRWIATGGGGYDWRAVTRAWAMIWLVMNDIDIPDGPLPPNVMKEIQKYYDKPIDLHWRDPAEIFAPIERRSVIDVNNYNAMQRALSVVCP